MPISSPELEVELEVEVDVDKDKEKDPPTPQGDTHAVISPEDEKNELIHGLARIYRAHHKDYRCGLTKDTTLYGNLRDLLRAFTAAQIEAAIVNAPRHSLIWDIRKGMEKDKPKKPDSPAYMKPYEPDPERDKAADALTRKLEALDRLPPDEQEALRKKALESLAKKGLPGMEGTVLRVEMLEILKEAGNGNKP